LIENFEVHFSVSTVLVKWYLPERFIPQYYFYAGCRVIVSTIILEERNSINCFRRVLHHIESMSPEPSVRRGSRKKPVRLAEMTLDIKLWQKSNNLPFPAVSLNNGVLKSVSTTACNSGKS
jgi:hypothetical protein